MSTRRTRPSSLRQEPEALTWAREKAGLTKRALAEMIGISEQLAGEMESGWRSATPANLQKIAEVLNCPVAMLERKRATALVSVQGEPPTAVRPPARVPPRGVVPLTAGRPEDGTTAYDGRLRDLEAGAFRAGQVLAEHSEHSEHIATVRERRRAESRNIDALAEATGTPGKHTIAGRLGAIGPRGAGEVGDGICTPARALVHSDARTALAAGLDVVKEAVERADGVAVDICLVDAPRADHALVAEYAAAMTAQGAGTVVLADTVGDLLPGQARALFQRVAAGAGAQAVLASHLHNDLGLGLAPTVILTHLASRRVLRAVAERLGHDLDPSQTGTPLAWVKDRAYRLGQAVVPDADFAAYLDGLTAPAS